MNKLSLESTSSMAEPQETETETEQGGDETTHNYRSKIPENDGVVKGDYGCILFTIMVSDIIKILLFCIVISFFHPVIV